MIENQINGVQIHEKACRGRGFNHASFLPVCLRRSRRHAGYNRGGSDLWQTTWQTETNQILALKRIRRLIHLHGQALQILLHQLANDAVMTLTALTIIPEPNGATQEILVGPENR